MRRSGPRSLGAIAPHGAQGVHESQALHGALTYEPHVRRTIGLAKMQRFTRVNAAAAPPGNLAFRDVYRDETSHPAASLTVSRALARVGRRIRPEAQAHHE
jgi:hypothetical protein